jgi:hypothetical protein
VHGRWRISSKILFGARVAKPQFFERVAADVNMHARYQMALHFRADLYADETIEIADDPRADTYISKDGVRRMDHGAIGRSKVKIKAHVVRLPDRLQVVLILLPSVQEHWRLIRSRMASVGRWLC